MDLHESFVLKQFENVCLQLFYDCSFDEKNLAPMLFDKIHFGRFRGKLCSSCFVQYRLINLDGSEGVDLKDFVV